jgi:hypothetical protein
MVHNTKKIKKEKILKNNCSKTVNKHLSGKVRKKIKLPNVRQQIVLNISILSAFNNMM